MLCSRVKRGHRGRGLARQLPEPGARRPVLPLPGLPWRSRWPVSSAAVLATWPSLRSPALWGLVPSSPSRCPRRAPCVPAAALAAVHGEPAGLVLVLGWLARPAAGPPTPPPRLVAVLVSSVLASVSCGWSWGPGAGGAGGGCRRASGATGAPRRLCSAPLLFCAVSSVLPAWKCEFRAHGSSLAPAEPLLFGDSGKGRAAPGVLRVEFANPDCSFGRSPSRRWLSRGGALGPAASPPVPQGSRPAPLRPGFVCVSTFFRNHVFIEISN